MLNSKFDLIIIGGGAAAFASAIKANELGAKTVMINDGLPLGGTCVNVGCVPSKTLLHAGEVLHTAKHHGIPGLDLGVNNFDFRKIISDELALVERLRKEKYSKVLKELRNVTFKEGRASFLSKDEVSVNGSVLRAEKIVIAAGSKTTVPPIEGLHDSGYITHIEALKLKQQPKELVVIGAGPLGLEFAQMYSRFGTRVTILERLNSIFPPAELELSERLNEILTSEGIAIKTNVEVKSVRVENQKKIVSFVENGKKQVVSGDELLLAAGKTPNTLNMGLENVNVNTDRKGSVIVNEFYQTSQTNIFAAGDVTNLPLRLETTAGFEGSLAAENALTGSRKSIDYRTVPYTIFTDPQLAGVGFTEEEEMKELGTCLCRTVSFEDIPKAIIVRRTEGLIKMVIHPETRVILGVHILSPNASELIALAMMLVKNKNTIDDVTDSLPMFPTLAESIKTVAMSFTKDISKLSCCI
jgi:mercuric reductase